MKTNKTSASTPAISHGTGHVAQPVNSRWGALHWSETLGRLLLNRRCHRKIDTSDWKTSQQERTRRTNRRTDRRSFTWLARLVDMDWWRKSEVGPWLSVAVSAMIPVCFVHGLWCFTGLMMRYFVVVVWVCRWAYADFTGIVTFFLAFRLNDFCEGGGRNVACRSGNDRLIRQMPIPVPLYSHDVNSHNAPLV